jgi:hypothetical protein
VTNEEWVELPEDDDIIDLEDFDWDELEEDLIDGDYEFEDDEDTEEK